MTEMTIFMLVRATPAWLALTPTERFAFVGETIRPALAKRPELSLRYFDAEAFSARVSDVMMWRVADMAQWLSLVEDLRETRFWGDYFEVLDIIPAVEDAYATHYGVDRVGTSTPAG